MKKFTFKTERQPGRAGWFSDPIHYIKYNKIVVGNINHKKPHKIRLMVYKKDIMEDGNPNCSWKWITLKKESESIEDAKIFLNEHVEDIFQKFNLKINED
jgi:hypothetical protein